ncbi:DUF1588 domain-containing protein [Lignipirellula cremea]|uniref:Planctomycete cytochrome C n=1 Tax=Lignipirellula cremea TaxID=2528010 RepID=A0A518DXR6_9BACT|nr:DUF1588 domain-containing protein [Lignipirellula cremea]QDU96624.1 Planctomycete cytochrome C [Lignipirellula cremea]
MIFRFAHARPTVLCAACCLALQAWLAGGFAGADEPTAIEPAAAESSQAFARQAPAFVAKYCTDCHGADLQEGGLRLDRAELDLAQDDAAKTWVRVLEQVLFAEMPPEDASAAPSSVERAQFVELVEGELSRFGRGISLAEKMLLPEYGNFVDHDQLFSGQITDLPYTPARLWRQRPDIYRQIWGKHYGRKHMYSVKIGGTERDGDQYTVHHGPHKGKAISGRYFADERFANPFFEYVHPAAGFTDYATIPADQASLEALLTNAETMAEILTVGTSVTVVTEVKSKDSRFGNNHGNFVGGVETIQHERRGQIPVAFSRVMESPGKVSQADFREALRIAFQLFLRRDPNDAEVDHYWRTVFQKNAELGNTMALQAVLIYIAVSPEFVYRMETGLGPADEHGRRMLSPHELVYAVHYAFQNTAPFGVEEFERKEIYTKAAEPLVVEAMTQQNAVTYARNGWLAEEMLLGQLQTKADVERAVRKYLGGSPGNMHPNHNSPLESVKNPRVLQFFREFFGYHQALTVFKDVNQFASTPGFEHFHDHTPTRLMYDTDALVLHILQQDKHVFEELLTTNKVFVSYWSGTNDEGSIQKAGGKKKYAAQHDAQSYNLDPFESEHPRNDPILVPSEQRCGVLTQPSWLVAHSGNFDNDPVRRGKWIREKLLAGYIMDVPITVDAQIPDSETETLRERFRVVRADSCWRCHKKMNPLGMPFEAFNHVGRFRLEEMGKPVDTHGGITYSGTDGLDGEVENVHDMMHRLAASPRVRQSFIRHMFRYWMGRNEMLSDSQTLIAMDQAYVQNEGSFQEALVALLTSDSFLYRK